MVLVMQVQEAHQPSSQVGLHSALKAAATRVSPTAMPACDLPSAILRLHATIRRKVGSQFSQKGCAQACRYGVEHVVGGVLTTGCSCASACAASHPIPSWAPTCVYPAPPATVTPCQCLSDFKTSPISPHFSRHSMCQPVQGHAIAWSHNQTAHIRDAPNKKETG